MEAAPMYTPVRRRKGNIDDWDTATTREKVRRGNDPDADMAPLPPAKAERAAEAKLEDKGSAASGEPVPSVEPKAALLITETGSQGVLEFELDGHIYRVKDHEAFKKAEIAVAKEAGPPPKRSLRDLKRAQELRRQCQAVEARHGSPGGGAPARPGQLAGAESSGAPSDADPPDVERVERVLQAARRALARR
mmetsp:Transcript_115432/g.327426  ORF Transcript_115432/g.327426 Transcript_115432/m.327426 type:complete len:192 (-) Transcript_115432:93-668(-)